MTYQIAVKARIIKMNNRERTGAAALGSRQLAAGDFCSQPRVGHARGGNGMVPREARRGLHITGRFL